MLSDWQMERVRARLVNYLDLERNGRRRLPISKLLDRMVARLCSEEKDAVLERAIRSIDNDTMRRFVDGSQTLGGDRPSYVKQFLIGEGVLSEAELVDDFGDGGELHAMLHFLANKSLEVEKRFSELEPIYRTSFEMHMHTEVISLEFEVDESRTFARVEEHRRQTPPPGLVALGRKDAISLSFYKRGYALLATKLDLLHIFVCGGARSDRIHYVQCIRDSDLSRLVLLRVGEHGSNFGQSTASSTAMTFNVREFVPEGQVRATDVLRNDVIRK